MDSSYKIKGKKNLHILDYGGWNGWLSNYLSQKGHQLVTTDLFIDEFDGRFNTVLNFFGQGNFFFSKKMTDIVDGSVD